MRLVLLALAIASSLLAQDRTLIIVSIDGMDDRYLRDRDALKLRTPNLRKLADTGAWVNGLIGIAPTVTWPSHTTLLTGVRAEQHGILENNLQTTAGSERYWFTSYLKAPTLWQVAKRAGKKVGSVNWPVTVGEGIDYNIPEYFQARSGGGVDRKSVEEKSTPGLYKEILGEFPSFGVEWMDDRARAQAGVYILRRYQPDLMLVHFMDHDEAAHESGPFSPEAIATLEHTDELLGQVMAAAPSNAVFAIVSDHGFEAAPRELNVAAYLASKNLSLQGTVVRGGYLMAFDPAVAAALSKPDAGSCIGREIPRAEVDRFLPGTSSSARLFESAPGCWFSAGKAGGELFVSKVTEVGKHGHWPMRYRASFVMSGPGIKSARLPEMDMREAVEQFAKVLGLQWPERK